MLAILENLVIELNMNSIGSNHFLTHLTILNTPSYRAPAHYILDN